MKSSGHNDARYVQMRFAKVYPLYLAKVERKGRTKQELDQVICWFSGFNEKQLQAQLSADPTFESFFASATVPPAAQKITGLICGVRVETIENPLIQKVRYLDKLVDELAKGRTMEKILRKD